MRPARLGAAVRAHPGRGSIPSCRTLHISPPSGCCFLAPGRVASVRPGSCRSSHPHSRVVCLSVPAEMSRPGEVPWSSLERVQADHRSTGGANAHLSRKERNAAVHALNGNSASQVRVLICWGARRRRRPCRAQGPVPVPRAASFDRPAPSCRSRRTWT